LYYYSFLIFNKLKGFKSPISTHGKTDEFG